MQWKSSKGLLARESCSTAGLPLEKRSCFKVERLNSPQIRSLRPAKDHIYRAKEKRNKAFAHWIAFLGLSVMVKRELANDRGKRGELTSPQPGSHAAPRAMAESRCMCGAAAAWELAAHPCEEPELLLCPSCLAEHFDLCVGTQIEDMRLGAG